MDTQYCFVGIIDRSIVGNIVGDVVVVVGILDGQLLLVGVILEVALGIGEVGLGKGESAGLKEVKPDGIIESTLDDNSVGSAVKAMVGFAEG